jgi:hypothetical protein
VDWGIHSLRKASSRKVLAGWAANFFHVMLLDEQAYFWEIMQLTALFDHACFLPQIELARFAVRGTMRDHGIWSLDLEEGFSLVTWLSTRWFSTRVTLLSWLAPQAIAGRGFTAVVAIFRYPSFQLFNAQQRPHQIRFQFLSPMVFLCHLFFEVCVRFFSFPGFFFSHIFSLPSLSSPSPRAPE